MCDENCIVWGQDNISPDEIKGKRILEVGSLNVNGTLRHAIEKMNPLEYIGVDIIEGNGVDIICDAENLVGRFGEESFDFVLSTCMLEHVQDWKTCVSQIKRVCKKGGYILIIVPSMYPYHEYPHDYWRFSKTDVIRIFRDCEIIKLEHDYEVLEDQKLSLVYLKCKKPKFFREVNLDNYEVYKVGVSDGKRP